MSNTNHTPTARELHILRQEARITITSPRHLHPAYGHIAVCENGVIVERFHTREEAERYANRLAVDKAIVRQE